jgi:LysR family transcriptional regulator, glycine cleavage system transcriptional activator
MVRRLPPLNALRAFEAAARFGSFVSAATELRVTASAVSQQVRMLERYLGTKLFKRLPRGLVLTELGRAYLPELTSGFDRLAEATSRLRSSGTGGLLTVAAPPSFGNSWLLRRIGRFRERYPRIDVYLRTSRELVDFRREDVDIAIRFGPQGRSELKSMLLLEEEVFPVASPALVPPTRMPLQVRELTEWPLLHDMDAYLPQRWMSWHAWLERAGVEPALAAAARGFRFSDSIILVNAAVAGLGLALARGPHVEEYLARGQLLRLTRECWKADWSYRLVGPSENFARPNVRAFTEWVLAEAQTS